LASWWRALNDEKLNSLVDRAVKSNLDLEYCIGSIAASAHIRSRLSWGRRCRRSTASAAAGRGTGSDLTKGRADQYLRSADNGSGLQQINTLAGFSRFGNSTFLVNFGAKLKPRATTPRRRERRDYDVLTAVVADVVRAYVDLRGFQVRAGILHKASDVLRESLRIVNIRYQRGITNELDVALATRELASLEAEIAPVEAQVNAAAVHACGSRGRLPGKHG
jgi:outer membrane protein TolC